MELDAKERASKQANKWACKNRTAEKKKKKKEREGSKWKKKLANFRIQKSRLLFDVLHLLIVH